LWPIFQNYASMLGIPQSRDSKKIWISCYNIARISMAKSAVRWSGETSLKTTMIGYVKTISGGLEWFIKK